MASSKNDKESVITDKEDEETKKEITGKCYNKII